MADEEFDELRRRLGAGTPQSGGAGPAGEQDRMLALSVVSGEVGELRARLEALTRRLEQAEDSRQGDARAAEQARERLQQEAEALRAELNEVAQTVAGLGEAVQALGAEDEEEKEKPPQPWDWEAMDWREELQALEVLVEWLPELHLAWGPAVSRGSAGSDLPTCWVHHPDMRRQVAALYTAYQQAYKVSKRRPHHETDWYRVLHERLHDIGELKKRYKCGTDQHIVAHAPSLDRWHTYLRARVIHRALEAQQAGETDELARIQQEYGISDEELYEAGEGRLVRARERFAALSPREDEESLLEAAELLLEHGLIAPDDLSQGRLVRTLYERLGKLAPHPNTPGGNTPNARKARHLRSAVEERYKALMDRYAAVYEVIEQSVKQRQAQEAGDTALSHRLAEKVRQLAEQHGVTDEEITVVWGQETAG